MINSQNTEYTPNYAVHPGEILDEILKEKGISQVELSRRSSISEKLISQIINCKAPVTPETAIAFERVLRTPAYIWNEINSNYILFRAEKDKINLEDKESKWVEKFPISEMKKISLIDKDKKKHELVGEVLKYFGVSDINAFNKTYNQTVVNFKKTLKYDNPKERILTWLRLGEIKANEIETKTYNKTKFMTSLSKIRLLVNKDIDNELLDNLKDFCAESGVAFVIAYEIKGTLCWGASKWLNNSKAMLLLSLRYKKDDHFWFSFFHEAAHIVLHKQELFTFIDMDDIDEKKEHQANEFARNILIDSEKYKVFVDESRFNKETIVKFAEQNNISPGVVVGRLQYDKLLDYRTYLNNLKADVRLQC